MPRIHADRLSRIGSHLLIKSGVSESEAKVVVSHLVDANLVGHDSHGIMLLPTYLDRMKAGHIVPGVTWTIEQETPTTTVIDGHWGFGFVVNEAAMNLTIEKARKSNIAATTVFRQSHIGRVASYALMAAKAGMIGIVAADSGRSPKSVAPFGGAEPRLGTNPLSVAVPSNLDGPLFIDMSTAAVALGKVKVAAAKGASIPEGWVVDRDGAITTDPNRLFDGGCLLPLGGTQGYKGYGLAVIVEILCGLLTGLGFGVEPTGRHNDGCFMAAFNVDAFRPLEIFKREVDEFARYLKNTKPSKGSSGVLYPGEIEHRRETENRKNGIEIDNTTWGKLRDLATSLGLGKEFEAA